MNNLVESVDPNEIPFFYDFVLFLKRLQNRPIKRTLTGAVSLTDIQDLISQFKEQERFEQYKEFGWKIHREDQLQFLEQIRLIAEVMFITYKRKGLLLLSKNGQGFLTKLNAVGQFREMVLHYLYKCNWGYFFHGREVKGKNLAQALQMHQDVIWKALLLKGEEWSDYKKFCHALYLRFKLEGYFKGEGDLKYGLLGEIDRGLFWNNLRRFGLVEVEEKPYKYEWNKQIVRFKSTPLGIYVFDKALNENYL